jgi:hypothetical protein
MFAGISKKYADKDTRLEEQKYDLFVRQEDRKDKNLLLQQEQNRFNTTRQDRLKESRLSREATAAQNIAANKLAGERNTVLVDKEKRESDIYDASLKDQKLLSEVSLDPNINTLGRNVRGAIDKESALLAASQAKFDAQKDVLNSNMSLADDEGVLSATGNKLLEQRMAAYDDSYTLDEKITLSTKDILAIDDQATKYYNNASKFLNSAPRNIKEGIEFAVNSATVEERVRAATKKLQSKGHSNVANQQVGSHLTSLFLSRGARTEKELLKAEQDIHKADRASKSARLSTLKDLRKNTKGRDTKGIDEKTFNEALKGIGYKDKPAATATYEVLLRHKSLANVDQGIIRSAMIMTAQLEDGWTSDKRTLTGKEGINTIVSLALAMSRDNFSYDDEINKVSEDLRNTPTTLSREEILADRYRPSKGDNAVPDFTLPYLGFSAVEPRLPEVDPNVPKAGSTEATRSVSVEALTAYDKLNKRQQARAQNPRQVEVNRLKNLRKEEETTSEELDRIERAINTARQVAVSPRALKWVKDEYAYNLKGYEKELVIANKRLAAIREQLNPQ